MPKLFANSGDPDQTLCSAASDLGLHCLPITLLRVSRLQWVNTICKLFAKQEIHMKCEAFFSFETYKRDISKCCVLQL